MKRTIMSLFSLALTLTVLSACSDEVNVKSVITEKEEVVMERGTFAKGADVSWLTQLESEGESFYNNEGVETECMELLKNDCNVNAIRLRVWVNPADGWNNTDDVLVKARRANALGLRVMIDFHFSDTWADPGSQTTPAAWSEYGIDEMKSAVASHVTEMLAKLQQYEVEPEWVQIGNETRTGMLWPLGEISNGANYAELTNAGYNAVKAIFPDCKVIVHLDGGDNINLYTRVFDYMEQHNGNYDIIGMSLYPDTSSWESTVSSCVSNINSLYSTYNKPVMVCEIGMTYSEGELCCECITKLMTEGKATGHLEGIFYWEPEAPVGYNDGYDKGCFVDGQPTEALNAFKE